MINVRQDIGDIYYLPRIFEQLVGGSEQECFVALNANHWWLSVGMISGSQGSEYSFEFDLRKFLLKTARTPGMILCMDFLTRPKIFY